jgi:hypothetical protein
MRKDDKELAAAAVERDLNRFFDKALKNPASASLSGLAPLRIWRLAKVRRTGTMF